MAIQDHIQSYFDPGDYLSAFELDGKEVTVVIESVSRGELPKEGTSQKERKPVLTFVGKSKKWVLNKTNMRTIISLYGSKPKDWYGKSVTLYPTTTRKGKDTVDCIRIRPVAPAAPNGGAK